MDDYVLINRIQRVDILHSLVRQDIKQLGIKLPKLKRVKKINQNRNSQDYVFSSKIFGEPLYQVHGMYIEEYGYVPQFLIDAAKVVDKYIETEGIFRKSGSITRQKDLQLIINEGKSIEAANIYDITSLIKQFFRELPEPIFVTIYHEPFIKCYHLSPDKNPKKALLDLCLLLPMENIGALKFTLHLLSRVAFKCEKNKMTANNLAVVMAPNLLHLNKCTEKMSSGEERLLHVHTCIIELLIKNWDLVGMVSPMLRQQMIMMSECFVTDDDIVASDDNTLEDSSDVLRRKKRKRSGSLTGFVSSIAQGIAKLRRSTDGKSMNMTNSYISKDELSMESLDFVNEVCEIPQQSVTPCVMRKRPICVENVPFSDSKKHAILSSLPQMSALASTPFTPASSVKKKNCAFYSKVTKTAGLNSTTPAIGSKTSRRKLNIFVSPGSNKKIKRQSSACARLQSPTSFDKSVKSKSFFRRLSGSRPEKNISRDSSTLSSSSEQIQQDPSGSLSPDLESTHLDSMTHDLKVVVDDQVHLNSDFENDASALANAIKREKYTTDCVQETGGLGIVEYAYNKRTPTILQSLPSPNLIKDLSECNQHQGNAHSPQQQCKNSLLSYSLGTGFHELRRNEMRLSRKDKFENEKSNNAQHKSKDLMQQCNIGDIHTKLHDSTYLVDKQNNEVKESNYSKNTNLPPPSGFGDETVIEDHVNSDKTVDQAVDDVNCDSESVSGFSTISGGTVVRKTETWKYAKHGIISISGSSLDSFMSYDSGLKTSFKSASSTDSLLSVESRFTEEIARSEPKLNRCMSSDSGKGSLLEVHLNDMSSIDDMHSDGVSLSFKEQENKAGGVSKSHLIAQRPNSNKLHETDSKQYLAHEALKIHRSFPELESSAFLLEASTDSNRYERKINSLYIDTTQKLQDMPIKTDISRKRSISSEDIGKHKISKADFPTRSHSVHISPGKKFNYKPHLEITRETHTLLARAGYFKPTDENFNSRYVQVKVKSPKRSSHREEMMMSLRSSFRERHSQIDEPVHSINNKSDDSLVTIVSTKDKPLFGSIVKCEKSPIHETINHNDNQINTINISQIKDFDAVDTTTKDCEQFKSNPSVLRVKEPEIISNTLDISGKQKCFTKNETGVSHFVEDKRSPQNCVPFKDPVLGVVDNDTVVQIKRANLVLQKHDSIENIQQAGLVTQSVKHFTESHISGKQSNFAMPVIKRGTPSIRIPTVFINGDLGYKHYKHSAKHNKNMVQNTEDKTAYDNQLSDIEPKTYPPKCVENNNSCTTAQMGGNKQLNESLVETIAEVCTPYFGKSENKMHCREVKSPLMDSTNTSLTPSGKSNEKVWKQTSHEIKQCQKDKIVTNRRHTPMKANWHNVKRLQIHSSPRKTNVRSPKLKTHSQPNNGTAINEALHLFSSADIHLDKDKQ